ncbi:hypothetical protein AVEN_8282-1 [Araneus ventricosus]|uniref:Tc1-like transposase DDE domain-containing protein n=1 Tax=Araneus ventricosus TaxID=182803 RepID=A0A4Y2FAG9_ARAVE|nr:hypothetical protein AVEN_8282-1 [Araneus ventricosus]
MRKRSELEQLEAKGRISTATFGLPGHASTPEGVGACSPRKSERSEIGEIGPSGPVTCTVNGTRCKSFLRNQLIPALQQRGCVDITIFMQDGTPPHIATPVKQLLNLHFGNDRIISRHFPTAWPPRSPDLNPCDFWLWGYLKDVVYGFRLRT